MKENADKLLESVVEKAMKSLPFEGPSIDFTHLVMAQVNSKSQATIYQPLISKTGWTVIMVCVVAFMGYVYIASGAVANDWFKTIDFSMVANNKITNFFSEIQFAEITFYAMLVCGVMLCAQIPILKYFIDKRQQSFT